MQMKSQASNFKTNKVKSLFTAFSITSVSLKHRERDPNMNCKDICTHFFLRLKSSGGFVACASHLADTLIKI